MDVALSANGRRIMRVFFGLVLLRPALVARPTALVAWPEDSIACTPLGLARSPSLGVRRR